MKYAAYIYLIVLLVGCMPASYEFSGSDSNSNTKVTTLPIAIKTPDESPIVTTITATLEQCPLGGTVVLINGEAGAIVCNVTVVQASPSCDEDKEHTNNGNHCGQIKNENR